MAEWKERGYVPDSDDDEEEEGFDLLSRDGSIEDSTPRPDETKERPSIDDSEESLVLDAPLQVADVSEIAFPTTLAGLDHRNATQSGSGSQSAVQQAESKGNGNVPKGKETQKDALRGQSLTMTDHAQVAQSRDSVAEILGNELQSGLDMVTEILRGSPTNLETFSSNCSGVSSPLSSVRSVSPVNNQAELVSEASSEEPVPSIGQPSGQGSQGAVVSRSDYALDLGDGVPLPRRNLRQRNPIQLHPYALEGARYQQELLARGMKPVYVAGSLQRKSPEALETQDRDFQDNAGEESQDVSSSQPESSGPLQPIHNSAVKKRPIRKSINISGSDEELPDLNAILEGTHSGLLKVRRRPKVIYTRARPDKNFNGDNDLLTYDLPLDSAAGFASGGSQIDSIFHVPPSPPLSRGAQSSQSSEALLKGLVRTNSIGRTPQALPTPNLSSAAQQPKEMPLQCDDGSDPPETRIFIGSSSPSSQSSLEQGDSQIVQFQKRTKGVLPASFFRIRGRQEISRKNQARRWSPPPERDIEGPGVAHIVPRNLQQSPSRASNDPLLVSDDSSNHDSSTETFDDAEGLAQPKGYYKAMGLLDGDIEEDNGVDMMIQPQSRRRKLQDPTKKRQRRISEFGRGISNHNHHARREQSKGERIPKRRKRFAQPGTEPQIRKWKTPRTPVPSLGPLDAPGYTNLPKIKQPHFLRVATRRARSHKTGGRQSPSRKFLQLATAADNHDANSELERWRKGDLGQNARAHNKALSPNRRQMSTEHRSRQGPRGLMISRSGPSHFAFSSDPRSPRQHEHNSPSSRRIQATIEEIVHRRTNNSDPSPNVPGTSLEEASADGTPAYFQPAAPLRAHHQNRSGRGTLLSSNFSLVKPREAQVESLRKLKTRRRIINAFQGRWNSPPSVEPHSAEAATIGAQTFVLPVEAVEAETIVNDVPRKLRSRTVRKHPPSQVDITSLNVGWKPQLSDQEDCDTRNEDIDALSGVVLAGLGSPEFPITVNFGIVPLKEGTCSQTTSFINDGLLSTLMHNHIHRRERLFSSPNNIFVLTRPFLGTSPYRWGGWDHQVSQQFSAWFVELRESLGLERPHDNGLAHQPLQNALAATFSLITYLGCHATFQDRQCLLAFSEVAVPISEELILQIVGQIESRPSAISPDLIRLSNLLLVFVFEIADIVASASLGHKLEAEVCKIFKTLALVILKVTFRNGHLQKTLGLSEPGTSVSITSEWPDVDIFVMINNLSKQTGMQIDLWDLITEALRLSIGFEPENLVTFQDYDSWWKGIFMALPLLELDALGLLQRRSAPPGWDLVQRLLLRFLRLFMPRRHITGYSTKHYGRVLIQRCLDLAQVWGWQGGHSAVGTLFDTFGSHNMSELFGEMPEHHFSIPLDLSPGSLIQVQKSDSGFHSFLGLLAQTILDSRKSDADPKLAKRVLRSLSARLVPAKGGDLPRHMVPNYNEIIALRNRFDLVSVMYCAMPAEMKPSLRLFQSFVDFRNGHLEACKIALQCWSRLVQHQSFNEAKSDLSEKKKTNDHSTSTLPLLREWHDSMVTDLLAEYSKIGHQTVGSIEHQAVCSTETRHALYDSRRVIGEILREALKTGEQSFGLCSNVRQAAELFSQKMLGGILGLFDTEYPASNAIVSAALQVIREFIRKATPSGHPGPVDEDSQEYGNWDDFDEMVTDAPGHASSNEDEFACLLNEVYPILRRFLSNVFGSDNVPSHVILKSTADCWYEVADALVRVKARSWNDFVVQYSTDSWDSLRHTQQSQQYKVYFLTKVIDEDYRFYCGNRLYILSLWISALCRPKHLLCWEHLLTSTILFHDSDNELLFNPPFAVRSDTGDKIEISMRELCERRRSMIYVLLRNMHRLLAISALSSSTSQPCSKADFVEILRAIESSMKTSYQDLEPDQPARNEYRDFLNFVVQQMQLYVIDFHKLDTFFTDPAISSAEAYAVTAALKRYSLTIETTGVTKAMVLFLYNASERAAITDTQDQFTLQLTNAFLDLSQEAIERTENYASDAMLLISFVQNVLPAYISHAFSEPGHIIAAPILQVLTHTYRNLRCRPDLWNASSLQQLIVASAYLFRSTITAFRSCNPNTISASATHLQTFNNVVTLIHAAMMRTYEAAHAFPHDLAPTIQSTDLIDLLLVLKNHILSLHGLADIMDFEQILGIEPDNDVVVQPAVSLSPMAEYAERELVHALGKTWRWGDCLQGGGGGWVVMARGRGEGKLVRALRGTVSVAGGEGEGDEGREVEMEECRERMRFVVRGFVETFARLEWWE